MMKKFTKSLILGACVSVLALSAGLGHAQTHPFGYEDLVSLNRLSALNVDPSGQWALFSVRATNLEKNKGVTSIWMRDLTSANATETRLKISDGGANNAQWSPDGQWIYFISSRSGTDQVWRSDRKGETATQVTSLPLDVGGYKIAPDGRTIIVTVAVFPQTQNDEIAETVKKQIQAKDVKTSGIVYDRLFVRHWDTWADGTRNHLFSLAIDASGVASNPVAMTQGFDGDVPSKPFGDEAEFEISKDSKTLYFSGHIAGKSESWTTNFDVFSVDISTPTKTTNLTPTNQGWDTSPRVSPDGKTLAYKAMKRDGFEADRFWLYLKDIKSGIVTPLAQAWDRSVDDMAWSKDGKSLLVTADDIGRHRLFRIDIKSGAVTPLSKDGHIDGFAETPKGYVFLKSGLSEPSQLYQSKTEKPTYGKVKSSFIDDAALALTSINAAKLSEAKLSPYEQFSFAGWNNETVYGYVVKPANYVEGKTYPVAFIVHGGPQSSFSDAWSYRWNAQTYAGEGFAVVFIDFHGSPGYGQAFTDSISQHWGDRPLEDLQKGWAYALSKYKFLDGDRSCALGASYGGFMINWIAGNWKTPKGTKGWKCLVNHDGLFDTRSMGYGTEELWFSEWENGGDVYHNAAKFDEFNPALHAKDWSIPMLVIHSDKDYRVMPEQGISTFTALQRQGIESKFLRFPDENHWVLKPQNSLMWHKTVMGWIKDHTKE